MAQREFQPYPFHPGPIQGQYEQRATSNEQRLCPTTRTTTRRRTKRARKRIEWPCWNPMASLSDAQYAVYWDNCTAPLEDAPNGGPTRPGTGAGGHRRPPDEVPYSHRADDPAHRAGGLCGRAERATEGLPGVGRPQGGRGAGDHAQPAGAGRGDRARSQRRRRRTGRHGAAGLRPLPRGEHGEENRPGLRAAPRPRLRAGRAERPHRGRHRPGRQRREVHARGRAHRRRADGSRRAVRAAAGGGLRHRHPRGRDGAALQALLPRRQRPQADPGRHGAGAGVREGRGAGGRRRTDRPPLGAGLWKGKRQRRPRSPPSA